MTQSLTRSVPCLSFQSQSFCYMLYSTFQFSTLDFNSRRARTLLDPLPDSDSDSDSVEGPSANPHDSRISQPRAPDDFRAQEAPPPPSVLESTAQPPSAQAVIATGTNIHSQLLPTSASSHVPPQPSASALSYRSGTKAKSPLRHVSFSFDGRPLSSPSPSPQPLASSSLVLSPRIPLAAPDSDPPRLPRSPLLEISTPATSARRISNPPTREGSRFGLRPGDDSNPFIDVINDTGGDDEEEEEDDELDELDNSHSHPESLPPVSSPSAYDSSSRRSRTPQDAPPQPTGPPPILSAIEESVNGLRAPARSTSRSVILWCRRAFSNIRHSLPCLLNSSMITRTDLGPQSISSASTRSRPRRYAL